LGYICKIKIYAAEGQKLDDTVLSVGHSKLGQTHHIHQAIFAKMWDWLKHCHTERREFVALWGLTSGILPDLEYEASDLKTGQSAFQKKGDITVQMHTDCTAAQ